MLQPSNDSLVGPNFEGLGTNGSTIGWFVQSCHCAKGSFAWFDQTQWGHCCCLLWITLTSYWGPLPLWSFPSWLLACSDSIWSSSDKWYPIEATTTWYESHSQITIRWSRLYHLRWAWRSSLSFRALFAWHWQQLQELLSLHHDWQLGCCWANLSHSAKRKVVLGATTTAVSNSRFPTCSFKDPSIGPYCLTNLCDFYAALDSTVKRPAVGSPGTSWIDGS